MIKRFTIGVIKLCKTIYTSKPPEKSTSPAPIPQKGGFHEKTERSTLNRQFPKNACEPRNKMRGFSISNFGNIKNRGESSARMNTSIRTGFSRFPPKAGRQKPTSVFLFYIYTKYYIPDTVYYFATATASSNCIDKILDTPSPPIVTP